ncbi:MAG: hypothetical protein WAU56_07420 [Steroidobacteraceae bacterium]
MNASTVFRCERYGSGRHDWRLVLKGVRTNDARMLGTRQRRRTRDDLLNAIPTGKLLALGTVWTGSLKPLVDATIEALGPIVSGFTLGRTLHAENTGAVLDLGLRWLGQLHSKITDAVASNRYPGPSDTDVGELLREVESLERVMATGPQNFAGIQDGFRGLRAARDALTPRRAHDTRDPRIGGFSKAVSGQELNNLNARYWAAQPSAAATQDASAAAQTGRVRDALHAVSAAQTGRERAEAINRAHREFWAR